MGRDESRSAESVLWATAMDGWLKRDLVASRFPDQRLNTRLGTLLADLCRRIGETVPTRCQDWFAGKAACGFFRNRRVDESLILAGHFAGSESRIVAPRGLVRSVLKRAGFS